MKNEPAKIKRSVRALIVFFIIALVLSDVTAFPLETELRWLVSMQEGNQGWINGWLIRVYTGLKATNEQYPFIAYGSDWLALHIW